MSNMDLRRLARDSIFNIIRQVWRITMGVLISVLLSRGLGKELRGVYALVVLLPEMLVILMNLGIGPGTVYYLSRKDFHAQEIISENILLSLWLSIGGMIVGFIIIQLASDLLFEGISRDLLYLSLMILPIRMLITLLIPVFQGMEDFRNYNLVGMTSQLPMLILLLSLVWLLKLGVFGALFSYIFSNLIALMFLLWILWNNTKPWKKLVLFPKSGYVKHVLLYGIKAYLGNLVTYLNYRLDIFLLSNIAGTIAVGIYSVSVTVGEQLWMPSAAIGLVLLPRIASLEDEEDTRKQLTPLTTRHIFWLSLCLGFVVWIISDWGILVLYSDEFLQSALSLRLLIPGIVMLNTARLLANDIAGRGRPEINLYISLGALIVNVISNLLLIPGYGSAGAAISSSISYTLLGAVTIIIYHHITGVTFKELLILNKSDINRLQRAVRSTIVRNKLMQR